jgi:hypothetical protein
MIEGFHGDTIFCVSECLLFLIFGLLIVQIYLNMASLGKEEDYISIDSNITNILTKPLL